MHVFSPARLHIPRVFSRGSPMFPRVSHRTFETQEASQILCRRISGNCRTMFARDNQPLGRTGVTAESLGFISCAAISDGGFCCWSGSRTTWAHLVNRLLFIAKLVKSDVCSTTQASGYWSCEGSFSSQEAQLAQILFFACVQHALRFFKHLQFFTFVSVDFRFSLFQEIHVLWGLPVVLHDI